MIITMEQGKTNQFARKEPVAAIFYGAYSTLCICVPTQTPCVFLRVQSSERHVLFAFATESVRGTHSLRPGLFKIGRLG